MRICDKLQVFYFLNMGLSFVEMEWPSPELYALAGKNRWRHPVSPSPDADQQQQAQSQQQNQPILKDWEPKCGTEGVVIHRWVPNHSDSRYRTNHTMPILLIECEEGKNSFFVPVGESGAVDLGAEV